MKKFRSLVTVLLLLCLVLSFAGCDKKTETTKPAGDAGQAQVVDYAGQVKLDMNSGTAKQEVTVKMFIDGDTTHFYVPSSVMSGGVLKARYLAINTPESTGKIEPYGKTAAAFTKEKLSSAESIIIESDIATWEADSTGDRYLSWVWYKPAGAEDYRNLNIEILQEGLAIASNSGNNRYGEICLKAIDQAKAQGKHVHSDQPDPNFYYGEAVELTLKELRTNLETYSGMKVAFTGVVTTNDGGSVYVESFDPESDMYYGMAVYYGYNLSGKGMEILTVGNEVRIVGSLQYYEAGGTWQVSDLNYRAMKPDDPNNIQKISEGNDPAFREVDIETFMKEEVTVQTGEESYTGKYAELIMNSSLSMKNLKVRSIYTTTNEDSKSKGAMTMTCDAGGYTITVRTTVLLDADGKLVTEDAFEGKTIDVKGLVDYYNGAYQIKVFSVNNINVH